MKLDVISLDNKKVGSVDLDDAVFGAEVRRDILARAVNWQLAKRRQGSHKVKDRSEISGGGKKPFNQKGGGRARQGTTRAPQMRGGGTVFGPKPRDHAHKLPRKVRAMALRVALSAKQAEGKLVILDSATMKAPKTAELNKNLKALAWTKPLLVDGDDLDFNFFMAARNVPGIDVLPSGGVNVYDILRHDTLVLTKSAVAKLQERLK